MPGKSRRVRRKISQGKRGERKQVVQVMTQPQAAPREAEPVAPAQAARPAIRPASEPQTIASQHPYVTGELRRIGIIAVIMLAALIALSLFLP
ncbi:hypothetical protein ACFLWY_03025 [Chloroflexota bacterium]